MGARQFSNIDEIIYQLLEKLFEMSEGQTYIQNSDSESACTAIRSSLYRQLKNKGITGAFTVRRLSPTDISITRIGKAKVAGQLTTSNPDVEAFIIEHLLDIYEELDAFKLIKDGLPQHQHAIAFDEWKRVVNPESGEPC